MVEQRTSMLRLHLGTAPEYTRMIPQEECGPKTTRTVNEPSLGVTPRSEVSPFIGTCRISSAGYWSNTQRQLQPAHCLGKSLSNSLPQTVLLPILHLCCRTFACQRVHKEVLCRSENCLAIARSCIPFRYLYVGNTVRL